MPPYILLGIQHFVVHILLGKQHFFIQCSSTFSVHGICQGISAGNRQIGLYAEIHSSQFRAGYATQASRLYVDELGQGTFGSGLYQ